MRTNYEHILHYYYYRRRKLLLLALWSAQQNRTRRSRRRWGARPINQERKNQGDGHHLINEMRQKDPEEHFRYCRMTVEKFDSLLQRVDHLLQKQTTNFKEPISARDRLYITLRHLVSGDAMASISYAFRIGRSTVSDIVSETCDVLWTSLQDELFQPSTENWKKIANEFGSSWQFSHCIGALDGKHVAIRSPPDSGSTYHNYKGFDSIVLMAVASADYKFLLVDIGAQGRHSDGEVFSNSIMGNMFKQEQLHVPQPTPLGNRGPLPYVLVADEAFALNKFTMRPYPGRNITEDQRIFNYRLSRPRMTVENTFGIMAARFRILEKPIQSSLETADKIVKAIVVLHNFLMGESTYCPTTFGDRLDGNGNIILGGWRADNPLAALDDIEATTGRAYSRYVAGVRNSFKDYFVNEGAIPRQNNVLGG